MKSARRGWEKEDGFNFTERATLDFIRGRSLRISPRLSVGVPGESRTAIRGERTPRFHFLLFQAFMFIAEYQTQQIQNLYAFFAFAISGVKHKRTTERHSPLRCFLHKMYGARRGAIVNWPSGGRSRAAEDRAPSRRETGSCHSDKINRRL